MPRDNCDRPSAANDDPCALWPGLPAVHAWNKTVAEARRTGGIDDATMVKRYAWIDAHEAAIEGGRAVAPWSKQAISVRDERDAHRRARRRHYASSGYALPGRIRRHLTEAQAAVTMALLSRVFETGTGAVHIGELEGQAGTSRSTTKRALAVLDQAGLIGRTVRRRGKTNLATIFTILDEGMLEWARKKWGGKKTTQPKGGRSKSEPESGLSFSFVPTDERHDTEADRPEPCRPVSLSGLEGKKGGADEPHTPGRVLDELAEIALTQLGATDDEHCSIEERIEVLRATRLPRFSPERWRNLTEWRGKRAGLALLLTLTLAEVRRGDIAKARTAAEKTPIRSRERYLSGILTAKRCRPEVTLAKILTNRGVALPDEIRSAVAATDRRRAAFRDAAGSLFETA